MNNRYLSRHRFVPRQIPEAPNPDLGIVVVIPCHNEPDLMGSLQSLFEAAIPSGSVEVIAVINASEKADEAVLKQNLSTARQAREWANDHHTDRFRAHVVEHNVLPHKHAGVGLARKIGMDEAVDRFGQVGNPNGIIVCFDADTRCQQNYFQAIEHAFEVEPKPEALSLHFEHPLSGSEYPESVYEGILRYELFLRYYIEAQRWAGHPHAHQTIGSSMAVTSAAYQRVGGMNRRKAGEDFYFLQKLISTGYVVDCATTTVLPSPRPSDRVPFGTGKAITDWMESGSADYPTYAWAVFEELKTCCETLPQLYGSSRSDLERFITDLPPAISSFLQNDNAVESLAEIIANTGSEAAFSKRVFQWFSAFKVLKFVHDASQRFYPRESLEKSVATLIEQSGREAPGSLLAQLELLRDAARSGSLFCS